jgi:hypothetical protein
MAQAPLPNYAKRLHHERFPSPSLSQRERRLGIRYAIYTVTEKIIGHFVMELKGKHLEITGKGIQRLAPAGR